MASPLADQTRQGGTGRSKVKVERLRRTPKTLSTGTSLNPEPWGAWLRTPPGAFRTNLAVAAKTN